MGDWQGGESPMNDTELEQAERALFKILSE
jgi:hypothetical protein